MKTLLHRAIGATLRATGLQYWPVHVRRGLPAGARWTLFPWTAYWRGGYEPEMERAILAWGDLRGKVCWDLGAHFGFYSISLALRTGPTGEVVAFEPNPISYARLERHRRMNGLTWLKSFEAGCSDSAGSAAFYTYGDLETTTTHLPYDGESPDASTQPISIRLMKLDDLVGSGQIRSPHFVKIDVEGHGHHALRGAIATIRRSRPVILMGFHSPQEVAGTEMLLQPLGYRFIATGAINPPDRVGADYLLQPPPREEGDFQLQPEAT